MINNPIQSNQQRCSIAIIGAGAAGLTAAHLIQPKHDVTIFEAHSYLGGHARTIIVEDGPDAGTPLDVGFMVLNDRNYPTLHKLLSQLGDIEIRDSEMSFSYYSEKKNIQYAINWSPKSQFAKQTNFPSPILKQQKPNEIFLKLLKEIVHFCRQAYQDLSEGNLTEFTLSEYLTNKKYSKSLINYYIIPMGAAIWSTSLQQMLKFPAETFIRFFNNHGLLSLKEGPQWQYIKGGSKTYVKAIQKNFKGTVQLNSPISYISRQDDEVVIKTRKGEEKKFDYVVIGTHGDEALNMLAAPLEDERRLLGSWKYQINHAILHTDESVMPPDKTSWASWNYTQDTDDISSLSLTYHLNRLQSHTTTKKQYFLSLNCQKTIVRENVLAEIQFTHPIYTFEAIKSQQELAELNKGRRTFFCGSYFGYGFHEDAIKSGVNVARYFGVEL
ncbi:MAG: FAD-dependent oxidoreductase [Prochloraceae cyanobacterium]|nr:FAD-dependent oxidoreductase [Prochloraceae cyanobacterium]